LACWIDKNEDFRIRDKYFEIKVTGTKEHKHIINGLDQLTPVKGTKKILISMLCENVGSFHSSETVNLPEKFLKIRSLLPKQDVSLFEDNMRNRGYVHVLHSDLYKDFNFKIYDPRFLQIEDSIECLNLITVPQALLKYISQKSIEYELNIQSLIADLEKIK
jgi:hypothetical protein